MENKLKPFNFEEAKASKPVISRDGRPTRIICWDFKEDFPIIALTKTEGRSELLNTFNNKGEWSISSDIEKCLDLFMLTEREKILVAMLPGH